jgi:O-antigen/teichoic acid export membrane protein
MNALFPAVTMKRLLNGQGAGATFLRGAVGSFAGKSLGLGMGFLLQVALARTLGVDELGIYAYALAWVTVVVLVATLGFDTAFMRFVSVYMAQGDWGHLRGLFSRAARMVMIASLVGAAVLFGMAIYLSQHWPSGQRETFMAAAVLIPLFSLSALRQAALRGLKRVFLADMPDAVLRPLLIMAVLGACWVYPISPLTARDAMLIQAGAAFAAFLLGGKLLFASLPQAFRTAVPVYESAHWLKIAFPMFLISAMHVVLKQTDVLMIGAMLGPRETGIYSVAVRLSDLAVFGLTAANAICAPMISEYFHAGKQAELQRIVRLAARMSFIFTALATAAMVLFGDWILGIFGSGFLQAKTALMILFAAQMVNALTGPVGFLMVMTGHQVRAAYINGAAVTANVVLNLILIPRYGIEGAAFSTAFSIVLWNVWMLVFVHRRLGIRSTV